MIRFLLATAIVATLWPISAFIAQDWFWFHADQSLLQVRFLFAYLAIVIWLVAFFFPISYPWENK